MSVVPREMCELSRLQLLNLSQNWKLQTEGYGQLAQAPLHKVREMAIQKATSHMPHS
jgi:hypothetical protein